MSQIQGPHFERLTAIAGSVSGRLIAIGGRRDAEGVTNSRVHFFEGKKLKPSAALELAAPVAALAFLADDVLAMATPHGHVMGADVSGEVPKATFGFTLDAAALALTRDVEGRRLFAATEDGKLLAFAFQGGQLSTLAIHTLSPRPLRAVAFDPITETLAAAGDEGVVFCVKAGASGGEPRRMPCGQGGVFSLAFTGDGRIAAGCGDGSIRLCFLDGAVDEEDRSGDDAHRGAVRALVLGPELLDEAGRPRPRRLFSAGADGTLASWFIDGRRKPKQLALGSTMLSGLIWVAPGGRAKPEEAGGRIAVSTDDRRLVVITLGEKSEPGETIEVGSAFEGLAAMLQARAPQARLQAVEAAAQQREDEARELLERALGQDGAPEVRQKAAEALGEGLRRRSRPALRAALSDPKAPVRAAALAALTAIEADAPLSPLRAALASTHPDIRKEALARLPALRARFPLVPGLVAEALSDEDREVRLAALAAVAALDPGDPTAPVRTALERAPADVRREALLGLARARHASTEAGNVLVERCLDDEDAAVRQAAFFVAVAARPRLLRQMTVADPAAGKAMAELPRGEGPAEGALTDEDLAPLFAAMACQHPDSAVLGARGLAALGDVRAIGALLQLSREPNARLRRWVVDVLLMAALAIPTDDRASGRLSWLLDDEDDTVAFGAFDALSMLATPHGAEGMLDHAEAALRAGRADVRHRALQILIQHRGSERADALLGEALDDESDKVRQEALRTLLAWHTSDPKAALSRGIASRHADVRRTVAERLTKISAQWAKDLLLSVVSDASSEVGLVALEALTKEAADKKRSDVFLMAMHSPRPDVRAAGCKGCHKASAEDLKARLLELVDDEHPEVHIAAIEAVDALAQASAQAKSLDAEAFRQAFGSVFYALRVRAGELLGKRRDERAIEPLKALLSIPKVSQDRPSETLRQRASRALADVGAPSVVPYYVTLLDDEDGVVREMGARGLATACRPGTEQPLVDALAHADLAVRSWAAEGLARLGDARALGVLAGTLQHEHRPIRIGAILGHVALGPDGVRGLLAGLQDPDRAIQDLTFSVVLARDIALARRGLEPDLLLSALSSTHPEIRFAAARALEVRSADEVLHEVARELVGPKRPERAGDMKSWPEKDEQARLLNVIVAGLASDHPEQRYASARILELRSQPEGFWREARRLATPGGGAKPHTNWEDEAREPKKKDWIRKLFGRRTLPAAQSGTERVLTVLKYAGAAAPRAVPPEDGTTVIDDLVRLLFGAYAGLVRQAPVAGEADETHRVRRDSLDRLAALARHPGVGRETALPIFRRGLSDPNHLVRRQAAAGLASLYPEGALAPMLEQLDSSADDVGRAAVDAVLERALAGDAEARQLAPKTLLARSPKVRAHALGRLPRLFEKGSVEPWFIALECPHADVRLAVVDRLDALPPGGADEGRIAVALGRALESEHADLRMKAAMSLAARGDVRTVDVFAAFLRGEDTAAQATRGLVRLGTSTVRDPQADCAALAARALAARIEEDPDATADKGALLEAMGVVKSPAAAPTVLALLAHDDASVARAAWSTLVTIARDETRPDVVLTEGGRRHRYHEALALEYAAGAAKGASVELRGAAARLLRDVDDAQAEAALAALLEDREESVRVAAAEALAFRAEHVSGATVAPLEKALGGQRRELVLPAALGLAAQARKEAFRPLMLVFKAGLEEERQRAVLGLGALGDDRAIDELFALVDPQAELPDEDRAFAPFAAEALGEMLPRIGDPERRKTVREVVERLAREGQPEVRRRALVGMRRAGDDESRHVLERVAHDVHDDAAVRQAAVEQLGILRAAASEQVLGDVLRDENRAVRAAALDALMKILPEDPTRVSLLGLDSPHADIAAPAAAFLAERGDPATLVGRMPAVKDAGVLRRLRQGLVRRQACPSTEVAALLAGEDAQPRAEAAWLAGACGDPALGPAVLKAVDASAKAWAAEKKAVDARAWTAALWAAGRLEADARGRALAAAGQADAPASVRAEALRFLARFGQAKDVAAIGACLTAQAAEVRAAAAAALVALAPSSARDQLGKVAVADAAALQPMVDVALAVDARGLLGSEAGRQVALPSVIGHGQLDALVALATGQGEDPSRTIAISSLGRIGGEAAGRALTSILERKGEPDAVRAVAFKALRRAQRAAEKHTGGES